MQTITPSRRAFVVCLLSAAFACCRKTAATSKANPAKSPPLPNGTLQPSNADRCPMCAMRVVDHPDWAGAIVLDDGASFYCCSVRCTFGTSLRSHDFLGVAPDQVRRVLVPDYFHRGKTLVAQDAFFIVDSDVRGPMGPCLVPVATAAEADVVVQRHGGRIIRHGDIDVPLLSELKRRSAA